MPGPGPTSVSAFRAARGLKNVEADLLNAVQQAVIATDPHGNVIYWNRSAEKLYGWSAEDVIGRHILDVTPTADSRDSAADIFARLQRGESWSGEFMVRHKDGRWFPVQVTDSPVCDENGELVAIVGVSSAQDRDFSHAEMGALGSIRERTNGALASILLRAERTLGTVGGPQLVRSVQLRSFAVALLIYGVAVAARVLLDEIVPDRLPFITFFPAVLASAFLRGFWPSIAVLLASAITGAWWADPPGDDVLAFRIWSFLLFLAIGGANLALVIWVLNILARLKRQDAQLALINRELKHRLKNLFAVTSSICQQTIRSGRPAEELAKAVGGRIQAVASAQDLLSITAVEGSDLRALVEAVVRPVAPDAARLEIEGAAVTLPAEVTTPFALILHELATNAVKHGAWAGRSITWRIDSERRLDFTWRERDGSAPAAPVREGLGTTLIKRGLHKAKIDHAITADGLDCRITLPL